MFPHFARQSSSRILVALTLSVSLLSMPVVFWPASQAALSQEQRTGKPRRERPEGELPDLEEAQRESLYEREAPAPSCRAVGVGYTDDRVVNSYLRFATARLEIIKNLATKEAAQGWKGIVPWISTRAHVERLLGQPSSSLGEIYTNRTPDNRIDVSYSSEPCTDANPRGTSSDIVLKLTVSPQEPLLVSKLELDRNKYVRIQHDHPKDLVQYLNSTDGIMIEARINNAFEEVISFIYRPTSKNQESRCGSIPVPVRN